MMRDKTKKKPKKSKEPIYDEPEGFSIPSKSKANTRSSSSSSSSSSDIESSHHVCQSITD